MLPPEISDLISRLSPDAKVVLELVVSYYESELETLRGRLSALEAQQSKNSKNSSKPPSTDSPFVPKPKAKRKKGGRKPGGQKGHAGSTLKMVTVADHTDVHELSNCPLCGESLAEVGAHKYEVRQSFDIPAIQVEVTEHRSEVKSCSCCSHEVSAAFPPHVERPVQYGPHIKTLLAYLQNYQMLPYGRTVELIYDLTGHQMSAGTVYNTQEKVYQALDDFETRLISLLSDQDLAHFDETGVKVVRALAWTHLCTTQTHAHFAVHAQRGKEAMEHIGILPNFEGTAVHDFWKSYFGYALNHAMCNAHLLRELEFIFEQYDQEWAKKLGTLLRSTKKSVDRAKQNGKSELAKNVRARFQNQYDKLVEEGFDLNPQPPPTGKPGRPRKPKPLNLLERFRDFEDAILRFMYEFEVPFDNNLAERNLRMLKVKLKVSGCFRSQKGAEYFMRIRSFLVTARMQGYTAFQALNELLINPNQIKDSLIFGPKH